MEPIKKSTKIIWIIVSVVIVFIIVAVAWLSMQSGGTGSVNNTNQPQPLSPEAAASSTSQAVSGSVQAGLDSMNFNDLNSSIDNLNTDINKL